MKNRSFTIGEIARGKMLIGKRGRPIADKASVLRALRARFTLVKKQTPHGIGYDIPQTMIDRFNTSRI